jgi:hemoglobin-like flavoprotein
MTADQRYLIRKSFAALEPLGTVPALVFYRRLFEIDPGLRPLFRNDIEVQSAKLLDMLGSLISHLESTSLLETELHQMGARHAGYGVEPGHYATVGGALLDMLAEVLREQFTPATREAWTTLYGAVADAMLAGAQNVEHVPAGA